ncbi:MAG: hypothetical protein E7452_07605 [Ruminococcaceae bacterium]|nr:hypothetical protein [Oscillospiraceae bacterium]
MKRLSAVMLVIALLASLVAGCGAEEPAASTAATQTTTATVPPQTSATTVATSAVTTTATTAATDAASDSSTAQTTTTAQTTSPVALNSATLYIPFDLSEPDAFALPYTGTLDVPILLSGIASLTGWNCDVTKVDIFSGTARIDLAPTSLPFAYDTHMPNETFFLPTYADTVFLFLDSIAQTLTQNLNLSGVIFTQDGGQPLTLERLYTSVELFPADTIYRGSAYYRALLLDDPYSNTSGYPMLQLAGGMTILYPNGFSVENETDTEVLVSAEDRVFITYRAYPLADEALVASEKKMSEWAMTFSAVEEQSFDEVGYLVRGTIGPYRVCVCGYMAPIKAQYFEVMFMYEPDVDFVDMEKVIADLSYALTKYN